MQPKRVSCALLSWLRFTLSAGHVGAIRGGGHNAAGSGICDDGLVIDLSGLRYAEVDPQASTVLVGGGCTWAEVDHATHTFGLAVPSGFVSTTGVGGLTLGDGLGYLTRKYVEGQLRTYPTLFALVSTRRKS
jgi:FAD/FMN-containing dehydrogenase